MQTRIMQQQISKKNPELTEALNKALQELKDDGTVQEILDKYTKQNKLTY